MNGYPGDKVVIARRKGNKWYVGGLNGKDESQTLKVKIDFIGRGNYNLTLIKDGKDDTAFSTDLIHVKKGDFINIECLPRGGFVAVLEMQNK